MMKIDMALMTSLALEGIEVAEPQADIKEYDAMEVELQEAKKQITTMRDREASANQMAIDARKEAEMYKKLYDQLLDKIMKQ